MEHHFDSLTKSVSGAMTRREAFRRFGSGLALSMMTALGLSAAGRQSRRGCVAQCCVDQCKVLAAGSGQDLGACISDCQRGEPDTLGGQIRAICELPAFCGDR